MIDLNETVLPWRAVHYLREAGFTTLEQLTNWSRRDLRGLEGIGDRTIDAIAGVMRSYGLRLRDEPSGTGGTPGEAKCAGKPASASGHRWGPRRELDRRREKDYTMIAYEQTCNTCGVTRRGEYSPDLLAGSFSIEVPKHRRR